MRKAWVPVILVLITLVVLTVDYVLGRYVEFPIVYLIPAGLAAWRNRRVTAYVLAVALPLARFGFHFPWHETGTLTFAGINAAVRIIVLCSYVYLIDRVSLQTMKLRTRVRTLEGILPICSSCKRIQNEKGEFEPMEKYVTEHSGALFSHGLCRECARELYPEVFGNKSANGRKDKD